MAVIDNILLEQCSPRDWHRLPSPWHERHEEVEEWPELRRVGSNPIFVLSRDVTWQLYITDDRREHNKQELAGPCLEEAAEAVERRETELRNILNDLNTLKNFEDVDDEYIFKPTANAFLKIKPMIIDIFDSMSERLPRPHFTSDGEGGVVASWGLNGRRVRIRFKANEGQRDYIYYQSNEEYDVEEATTENLIRRLEWLLHE